MTPHVTSSSDTRPTCRGKPCHLKHSQPEGVCAQVFPHATLCRIPFQSSKQGGCYQRSCSKVVTPNGPCAHNVHSFSELACLDTHGPSEVKDVNSFAPVLGRNRLVSFRRPRFTQSAVLEQCSSQQLLSPKVLQHLAHECMLPAKIWPRIPSHPVGTCCVDPAMKPLGPQPHTCMKNCLQTALVGGINSDSSIKCKAARVESSIKGKEFSSFTAVEARSLHAS
jgi:hypothetical protein